VPTVYNARDAGNCEKLMGRWSRRLAPFFIEHAGVADGEEVLEIGCGTGSLTFALAETAGLPRLTAIDQSKVYLAAAQAKNRDPRIRIEQGDGCALRFADASFDRTLFGDTAAALDDSAGTAHSTLDFKDNFTRVAAKSPTCDSMVPRPPIWEQAGR
jgi:SAM-dependent methyltransferase